MRLARRAVELGGEDAVALCWGGFSFSNLGRDLDASRAYMDKALALNPNLAPAWYLSGWVHVYNGDPEAAIGCFSHAMRLSPLDPLIFRAYAGTGYAHLFCRPARRGRGMGGKGCAGATELAHGSARGGRNLRGTRPRAAGANADGAHAHPRSERAHVKLEGRHSPSAAGGFRKMGRCFANSRPARMIYEICFCLHEGLACPLLALSGHSCLHCKCPLLTQSGHVVEKKRPPTETLDAVGYPAL